MRPLPPSDPNMIGPSRLAQHNNRLKRREGLILPTPRTYRFRDVVGSTALSTTSIVSANSIDVVLQPGETIGLMGNAQFACTSGNTCNGGISVEVPFTAGGRSFISGMDLSGSTFSWYASTHGGSGALLDAGEFCWYTDRVGTALTVTDSVTLTFNLLRNFGTGPIQVKNLDVWAMIL